MSVGFAQSVKRWIRVTRVSFHVLRGLATCAFLFPLQSGERRKREIEHWSLNLLNILNLRLFLHGKPPPYGSRPLMIVANHVSWIDIFAINAIVPARFISKAEVRSWPVVGWLSARAGTVFLERARKQDTVRVNHLVAAALRGGDVFAVFPEGTTTDGTTLLKFHASLLEPALEADAAIQPVALRYERSDGTLCTEASYADNKSMWDTLMAMTSQHEIRAHVCFLEPLFAGGRHRRDVAHEAREAILRTLRLEDASNRTETGSDLRAAAR